MKRSFQTGLLFACLNGGKVCAPIITRIVGITNKTAQKNSALFDIMRGKYGQSEEYSVGMRKMTE